MIIDGTITGRKMTLYIKSSNKQFKSIFFKLMFGSRFIDFQIDSFRTILLPNKFYFCLTLPI